MCYSPVYARQGGAKLYSIVSNFTWRETRYSTRIYARYHSFLKIADFPTNFSPWWKNKMAGDRNLPSKSTIRRQHDLPLKMPWVGFLALLAWTVTYLRLWVLASYSPMPPVCWPVISVGLQASAPTSALCVGLPVNDDGGKMARMSEKLVIWQHFCCWLRFSNKHNEQYHGCSPVLQHILRNKYQRFTTFVSPRPLVWSFSVIWTP